MIKKIAVITFVAIILILTAAACSTQTAAAPSPKTSAPATSTTTVVVTPTTTQESLQKKQPDGPIKAIWIEASVSKDTVSIPIDAVYSKWDTHFKLQSGATTMNFMAYLWNNNIYVRANICPPCRSIGFTLNKDILVCDTCGTTFQAKTGAGINGACVAYPKASVQYKIVDNNVVMNIDDLTTAYQKTMNKQG